ncbi:hypothetical protein HDU84_006366 [Entophlyctis sp. JEL0112]|nr:hypothetical protein HDU84_006366 [Entophlyctis sp. JEL0112]
MYNSRASAPSTGTARLNPFSASAAVEAQAEPLKQLSSSQNPQSKDISTVTARSPSQYSSSYYQQQQQTTSPPAPLPAFAALLRTNETSCIGSRAFVAVRGLTTGAHNQQLRLNDSHAKSHAAWSRESPLLGNRSSVHGSISSNAGGGSGPPPPLPSVSVFDASAAAWWHLKRGKEDQTIVLLGESGAGKTETRRLITRHLCEISTIKPAPPGTTASSLMNSSGSEEKKKKSKLVSAILKVETILAAFTRAPSHLNPDASCAAVYMEFQFSKRSKLCGVKLIDFLLNKSHVTGGIDEVGGMFHIFPLLLDGATTEEKSQWQLGDSAHYHYLNNATVRPTVTTRGVMNGSTVVELSSVREALKAIGVGKRQQSQIFQLLAAILHLGNIVFEDDDNKQDEPCAVRNAHQLSLVADLLGVHPSALETCLTYKTQLVKRDKISVFLDARAAAEQRDALARALYSVIVSYLIEQVNTSLCVTDEAQWSNYIAVLDLPGGEYLSDSFTATDSAEKIGTGHGFHRLLVNYSNARVEQFMIDQLFVLPREIIKAEGLGSLPNISSSKREMLEALDSQSGGLMRLIDTECALATRGSKLSERLRETYSKVDNAMVYSKYVLFQDASTKRGKHSFMVMHYGDGVGRSGGDGTNPVAGVLYDARGFIDSNTDVLQSDFVALVRGSTDQAGTSSAFLRGLFSDKMVATLTEGGAGAEAVVAAAERTRFPSMKRGKSSGGFGVVDSTVGQKARSAISAILDTVAETQQWFIMHLKQTDEPAHTRYDATCFQRQIELLGVQGIAASQSMLYTAALRHADFLSRFDAILSTLYDYAPSSGTPSRSQCEAVVRKAGWTTSQARVGSSKMFLSEAVWRRLEGGLCAIEEAEKAEDVAAAMAASAAAAASEYGAETEYGGGGDAESYFDSEFGGVGGKQIGDSSAAEQGRLLNKAANANAIAGGGGKKSELTAKRKTTVGRKFWVCITWAVTWWVPSFVLSICCKMKGRERRMAWREKVALCFIIAIMNALILFLIVGIGLIICPVQKVLSAGQISSRNNLNNDPLVYMYGYYYSAGTEYNTHLTYGAGSEAFWEAQVFGFDISQMFDKSSFWSSYCPAYSKPTGFEYFPTQNNLIVSGKWYQHGAQSPTTDHLPTMAQFRRGRVVWDSTAIATLVSGGDYVMTFNDNVYLLTAFYSDAYKDKNFFDQSSYMQAVFDKYSKTGGDASYEMNYLNTEDPTSYANIVSCMNGLFWIGTIDHRNDLKCQITNYILLAASIVLVLVIGVKFLAALQFGGHKIPEDQDRFVICLVPCYTEGEASLAKTLESLAAMEYEDKHKLLFIISDGMIIGSGNDRPTPRIVLDILGVDPSVDPETRSFESLGEGSKQHNAGKVYSGLYEHNGRVVPYVVVVKVGRPSERQRPGNRGKRDSQLILMRFLSRVHFDQPMNPLELDIYHHMKNVIGVDPSFYEFVFSVDADTEPFTDSLNRLIAQMTRDSKIIGLCGETMLANERESWVSMMQVYEYYISHNLSKAFESMFGSVTCLPGCFSIYRIRTPAKNIPLLISPGILRDYSENQVDTLHLKNLLHLGEDRYLTTLLMKHFPHMRTTFIADAKCKTMGPSKFSVLLSQRRRWINSTVHNLLELLMLKQLCGVCCFDMRFVVFIDLTATFIQPAALGYIIYLIYAAVVTPDQFSFPLISIIMLCAIYGFQIIIFILKREWQHIGWMIVYLLCIPFSALYIPVYAFWHFDDFSWGNTRIVVEDGQTKEVDAETEPFNPSEIPFQKWSEYDAERAKKAVSSPSIAPPPTVAGGAFYGQGYQIPTPMYPGSVYGGGSVYNGGGNGGGSAYGAVPVVPAASVYGASAYGQQPPVMMGSMFGQQMAGSVAGFQSGQQYQSVLGVPQPGVNMALSLSQSSIGVQPSDEQLLYQIRQILATADLMSVTRKSVREELTRVFGVDLSARKDYIHACIDGVLKGEL